MSTENKMNEFKEIFSKYTTDKVNGQYENAYEECFGAIRNDINLVFEIGVFRGESLKGWEEYFPNAKIVGLEIRHKRLYKKLRNKERIHIEIGDATDSKFIDKVITKHGEPDIVIDDGSHLSSHIKTSFRLLNPYTKFCYVIEDLGTQTKSFRDGRFIDDEDPATLIINQEVEKTLFNTSANSIRIYCSQFFLFKKQSNKEDFKISSLIGRRRMKMLFEFAQSCCDLPGAVAEVGVYKGGSLKVLADIFTDKQVFGIDTFEGMPNTALDFDGHQAGDFADTSYEAIRDIFRNYHPNAIILKGFFPDNIIDKLPDEFCFVHVDCDIYRSVKDCCEFFWPRLVQGGIMVFDDPCSPWLVGATKAFNEFDFDGGEVICKGEKVPWVVRKNKS